MERTRLTTQSIVRLALRVDRLLAGQRTMTVTRSAVMSLKLALEVAVAMMSSVLILPQVCQ